MGRQITSAVVAAVGALLLLVCIAYYRRDQEEKLRLHPLLECRTLVFTEHLLAFELTSILLLAAIVGAVAVGKRRAP